MNSVQKIDERTNYHIRVYGQLDENWSDRLNGMIISPIPEQEGSGKTLLAGELANQAALIEVLNTLYTMRLTLISVVIVDPPSRAKK